METLQSTSRPPLTAVTWQQLLAAARNPDDVVACARDFVATLEPGTIAGLPHECRPGKLLDTHDIAEYAYQLVRHDCRDADDEVRQRVKNLGAFFADAVDRLSQLATPAPARALRLFE